MKHNLLLVFWLINSLISYRAMAQTPNNLPPVNNCGESNEDVCIETSGMGVQAYRQSLFGNLNLSPAEEGFFLALKTQPRLC